MFLEPGSLEEAGNIECGVVDGINTVHLHLHIFLAQDTGLDVVYYFRTLVCHMIITTFSAACLLTAPMSKIPHLEAFETLRGTRLELGGSMIGIVKEKKCLLTMKCGFLFGDS